MCNREKINIVKQIIGIKDARQDDLISIYLLFAEKRILEKAFPFKPEIRELPDKYDFLQCEIAVYLFNKQGAEGQTSHTELGVSRSYEDADIPASMLKSVIPYAGVF